MGPVPPQVTRKCVRLHAFLQPAVRHRPPQVLWPASSASSMEYQHAEACQKSLPWTWQLAWMRRCQRLEAHGSMSDEAARWPRKQSGRKPEGNFCDLLHLALSGSDSRGVRQADTVDITCIMVRTGIWGGVDSPGVAHSSGHRRGPDISDASMTTYPKGLGLWSNGPQFTERTFSSHGRGRRGSLTGHWMRKTSANSSLRDCHSCLRVLWTTEE